jgi:hypothetical protein
MYMDKTEKKEEVCGDLLAETIFIIFAELAGFARPLRNALRYRTACFIF